MSNLPYDLPLYLGIISFFTSFISSYLGMLGGSIMLLVFLSYFDTQTALQFYTIHILINSLVQIIVMKKDFDRQEAKKILPVLAIITVIGIFYYKPLSLSSLKLVVCMFISYSFVRNILFKKKSKALKTNDVPFENGKTESKVYDYVWLSITGIINSLTGLGGQILAVYFLNKGYSKSKFICAKSSINILLRISALIIYIVHDGIMISSQLFVALVPMTLASLLACYAAKSLLKITSVNVHQNMLKIALSIAMIKSISSSFSIAFAG